MSTPSKINICCIGDIVGSPGREALTKVLPALKEAHGLHAVIANGENAAGGSGILPKQADEIYKAGVDAITLGDHVWDKPEIYPYLNEEHPMVRPANFPDGSPGRGWRIFTTATGVKIGVVNLLGRTFMRYNVSCPFKMFDMIYEQIIRETPVIVVDMHAETTSEKVAFGHYADGRASVVVGTHTHIQTADEKILPKGTAYITDLGMSGPYDSVIGQNKEKIIQRFLTSMPVKFDVPVLSATLHGIVAEVDTTTGRAVGIKRVQQA